MKRLLFTSLVVFSLTVLWATFAPMPARANALDTNAGIQGTTATTDPFAQPAADAAQQAASAIPTNSGSNPGLAIDSTMAKVMSWFMEIFALLLGVAAILLDNAVHYTVVTMGSYISSLSAIGVTWRIFRDIGNILLIFGFLAIGISTILNLEFYGWKTKLLPKLLISAIFLNFSLFVAEGVIDIGNLFATQFYTAINNGQPSSPKDLFDSATIKNEGISNAVLNQLGLSTIYGKAISNNFLLSNSSTIFIGVLGIIVFMIAAFVFFSLSLILVTRFVYLVYLIIIAPIGFAGYAIPKLGDRAATWWHDLFDQALTAPILLLLLYVALAVITDTNFLSFGSGTNARPDWAAIIPTDSGTTNYAGFASIVLSFLIAMGLLLMVVWASRKLSAWGGDFATKAGGALSLGVTAMAARSTIGWASQRAGEGWRRSALSRAPVLGRAVSGVLDRGGRASFDIRGAKFAGGLKGGLGIEAGEAAKGGYKEWEKAKIKEREDYAASLEKTTGKFVGLPYMPKKYSEVEKAKAAKQAAEAAVEAQKELEEGHRRAADELKESQRRDLEPHNQAIQVAQRRRAQLESDRARGGTVTDAELATADQAIADAQSARTRVIEEQRRAQAGLRDTQQAAAKTQKEKVEAAQKAQKEAEAAPSLKYANAISWVPLGWINRNKVAADHIKKKAAKSQSEKDMDSLRKVFEDGAKSIKEGGSAPAAPSAAAH